MPIRVMHIVEALGVGGGVEHGIANLIARMNSRRFEHVICAVFRLGPDLQSFPASYARVVCLEQKSRLQVGPITRIIREMKPDIIHSRNWGTLDAVIAGRWVRFCSVIHSEHGLEVNPAAEPHRRAWLRRGAFELAHRVFSVSYELRSMLSDRTGFPKRKIQVIHNGVDLQKFRPDASARQSFRREYGIEDEFCIGCVGRLNRIKDYPTVLRAAELFSKSCKSWRLLIAGGGPELPALQELVNARPVLRNRVCFLGATERVPEFLNAMDVYVMPSLWEGISNSLLEAMASRLPVVGSDAGGNSEVIVDGDSGLLFPVGDIQSLADQLIVLSRQPDLRTRLGWRAQERVQQEFSLDVMVQNYEQMYTALARREAA